MFKSVDFRIRMAVFILGMVALIAAATADGGPLPMCPPSKGPNCSLKAAGMMWADGSDPMPLCRTKGCGPFKNSE